MHRKIRFAIYSWLLQQSDSIVNDRAHRVADISPTARVYSSGGIDNITGHSSNAKIGDHTHIRGRVIVFPTGKFQIGEWSYIGHRSEVWSQSLVQIGNRVLISHDVDIHDGTAHSMDAQERHEHFKYILSRGHPATWDDLPGIAAKPIIIEDDVWISFGVTILQGVTIGKGSVIAAGSLVTKDVPPGVIYRCSVTPIITPLAQKK
ncbi:MAG: acyltransferase [Anaerolineales bacterium]|nr:acyltransferase [Anaerolineales bacterium]